ncbi:MAG TPA: hypothetical protein VGV87_25640 [Blastocatellia bacterium]|jgi:hypothetical protein|nr:hypothetical protein [Blastocatellia bacterium]
MMKILMSAPLSILLIALPGAAAQSEQQAQQSASANTRANASSQTRAKSDAGSMTLDAGSQLLAEMSSTVDLKKAKPGDSFKMKTTRPVKRDGKKMIDSGSSIRGHIEKITSVNGTTQASLVFDSITDSKTGATAELNAMVTAVVTAAGSVSDTSGSEVTQMPRSGGQGQSRSQAGAQNQTGGLIGGALNTVGGVAGGVTSTVDSTTSATVGTNTGLGGATGSLGRNIQVVNDTTAGVTTNSTLALPEKHTRIESGTKFLLQTTSALTLTSQPAARK